MIAKIACLLQSGPSDIGVDWSGNASNVATFRQREPAIQQRAEDLMIGLLPPEDLEKDVGVEADRHA